MEKSSDRTTVRRHLDTDAENPSVEIAETVAEIEDRDATDLPNIYGCIDDALAHVFSSPPSPEADLEIAFTYQSYRITVEQDGTATFESIPAT